MAARGTNSKNTITEVLLKTFKGSFLYNNGKELRIPCMENGELLQIKCTLTCAKDNVEAASSAVSINSSDKYVEPTAEDMKAVQELLKELGINVEE